MESIRGLGVAWLTLAVLLAGSPATAGAEPGTAVDPTGDGGPSPVLESRQGQDVTAPTREATGTATPTPVVIQNATVSRHPDQGILELNLSYRVGEDASALVTFDSHRTAVTDSHGFEKQPNGRWLWDGTTDRPWLSMRLRVTRRSKHFAGYAWYDAGSWAMARPPRGFSFYSEDDSAWVNGGGETPLVRRQLRVAGPGVAGSTIAYLGNYTLYATNHTDGRIRLIVPAAASTKSPPGTVLDVFERTARRLDVGSHIDRLNVFVAPKPMRRGGFSGGVSGATADIWIAENESLGAPANIWIHEYVHARQNASLGHRMQWFREASASYYAGLLSVRQGLGSPDRFDRFVDRLHRNTSAGAVLADRSTWPTFLTPYAKGQRVLATLDVRIRNRTGGEGTLMAVFRRMNRREGRVTYAEFERIVEEVAGTNMTEWVSAHVGSTAPVDPPRSPYAYVRPNGTADADGDGLSAARERQIRTHPFVGDSDADGLGDGAEVGNWTDPTRADSDGDGYDDGTELAAGSDPTNPFSVPRGTVASDGPRGTGS